MIAKILHRLRRSRKKYTLQTFTFYIPAPPKRQSGYREKEFDKLFFHFINRGFELISMHTQAHSGPQSAGMWVICTVRSTHITPEQFDLELYENISMPENFEYPPGSINLDNNPDV